MLRARFTVLILVTFWSSAGATLLDAARTFPAMPRDSADLIPIIAGIPTFASGTPYNDLPYTLFDTDYVDGENGGGDVFMPVDPSDAFPGSDRVKLIRCVLNTDLDEGYGAAHTDRVILGTAEIPTPFFARGANGVDDDYAVILHFDFEYGAIQLRGAPSDYELLYATVADGVATEGWYLFHTAGGSPDLIAFVFPCDDLEPPVSGNPPADTTVLCNSDGMLSLDDPVQFVYATPIESTPAVMQGTGQYGSDGKEIIGGMAVDTFGATYLFGCTDGNLDGATGGAGGDDAPNEIFVTRLDGAGREQWVTEIPMREGSLLFDAVADEEYVYVCGRTLGALSGFTNAGSWDGILLKLRISDGSVVATDQWGNAGIDGYGNIVLDDAGNLFVSGQGSPDGGSGGTDGLYLAAKHRTSDLSNVWRAIDPTAETGFAQSAEAWGGLTYAPGASPGDGRLVVAGWYFAFNGANAFVSVYDQLTDVTPRQAHSVVVAAQGTRADWILDNVVDDAGNVYVAGYTTGNLGGTPLGEGDAFVGRFAPDLTSPVFVRFGTARSDQIRKLSIAEGTLYAFGHTYGDLAALNADSTGRTGDVFVQKLDLDLNLVGSVQFGTPHEDRGYGRLFRDRVIVGGMTEGALAGPSWGSFDGYVVTLRAEDLSFGPTVTSIADPLEPDTVPSTARLSNVAVVPTPFNGRTSVEFELGQTVPVTVEVFDVSGRRVETLANRTFRAGTHVLTFGGDDLASGVYHVRVRADQTVETVKAVHVK